MNIITHPFSFYIRACIICVTCEIFYKHELGHVYILNSPHD